MQLQGLIFFDQNQTKPEYSITLLTKTHQANTFNKQAPLEAHIHRQAACDQSDLLQDTLDVSAVTQIIEFHITITLKMNPGVL